MLAAALLISLAQPAPILSATRKFDVGVSGLPDNTIMGLAEDAHGRVYAAAAGGIASFDGVHWNELTLPAALRGGQLWDLTFDDADQLWVASRVSGVWVKSGARWLRIGEEAKAASQRALSLKHCFAGPTVVVGTEDGAGVIEMVGDALKWTDIAGTRGLAIEGVGCEDKAALLATTAGVLRFDGHQATPAVDLDVHGEQALSIAVAGTGEQRMVAVGTVGGVWMFSHGGVRHVTEAQGMIGSDTRAIAIAPSNDGWVVWSGTQAGLSRIGPSDIRTVSVAGDLDLRVVRTLLVRSDWEKSLFVATQTGLAQLTTTGWLQFHEPHPLARLSVTLIHTNPTPRGPEVWFAAAEGVWSLTGDKLEREEDSTNDPFVSMVGPYGPDGVMYAGTRQGRLLERTSAGRWRPVAGFKSVATDGVWALSIDEADGSLVVGRWSGLYRFDPARGSLARLQDISDDVIALEPATFRQPGRGLFIGTASRGLLRWQGDKVERWTTTDSALPGDAIGAIHLHDGLWLGGSDGISHVEDAQKMQRWQHLSDNTTPRLPDRFVYKLAFDQEGHVYVSTNRGVVMLDKGVPAAVFDSDDGLPSSTCNQNALAFDRHGRLWVGTANGVAVFNPRDRPRPWRAPPFTLQARGSDGQGLLNPARLTYEHSSPSFRFEMLSYVHPQGTQYRSHLVGLEDKPTDWGNESARSFTKIPAGDYELVVSARDYRGIVAEPQRWPMTITPPPWATWWAYTAYGLAVAGVAYGVSRARIRQLRKRAEDLEATVQKRTEEVRAQADEILAQKDQLEQSYREADRIFDALKQALKGSLLDGKYRLDEEIGQGGFGVVYKASEIRTGGERAIKVFRPAAGNDSSEALERFKMEGRSGMRFRHQNAIEIEEFNVTGDGVAYMVMELLHGSSLKQELSAHGKLSIDRCKAIVVPICQALAAAHALGIVHRDVKPDNVFLHHRNDVEIVKVLDFGVAKLTRPQGSMAIKTLTMTGAVVGTPTYMAPERLEGEDYDGRSDVYSVGIMLYEMIAGRVPFTVSGDNIFSMVMAHLNKAPEPLSTFAPEVPLPLQEIIMRTLSKDPLVRPTAAELAEELGA